MFDDEEFYEEDYIFDDYVEEYINDDNISRLNDAISEIKQQLFRVAEQYQ